MFEKRRKIDQRKVITSFSISSSIVIVDPLSSFFWSFFKTKPVKEEAVLYLVLINRNIGSLLQIIQFSSHRDPGDRAVPGGKAWR